MKQILLSLMLFTTFQLFGQSDLHEKYYKAERLLKADKMVDACNLFKELEKDIDESDTLYDYALWYYTVATTQLEDKHRMKEDWKTALKYGLEAQKAIEKGKKRFNEQFAAREYWMIKNLIVSYFGLNQLEKAKKLRKHLYRAYRDEELPEGINEYYNFEYFKFEDKNIWGYEWFEELPKNTMGRSFSKIVYYVYSTNKDGSDKEQLYRLHVLMFHKIDDDIEFDYVLTKRLETATHETGGTLYAYTYNDPVDFEKLRADIREVIKGNLEPDTRSYRKK